LQDWGYAGSHLYLHLPAIHAYTNTTSSNANCHSHRFRQCHTDTQTKSFSETPHDTEAAPDSAAKAGYKVSGSSKQSAVSSSKVIAR